MSVLLKQNPILKHPVYDANLIKSRFVPFSDNYLYSSFNPKICLSYLNVICARPWGHNDTFGDLRSPKTSL